MAWRRVVIVMVLTEEDVIMVVTLVNEGNEAAAF